MKIRIFSIVSLCVLGYFLFGNPNPISASAAQAQTFGAGQSLAQPIQFRAENHVLGFLPTRVYFTGMDHMLRVDFVGTSGVMPQFETGGHSTTQSLAAFQTATYPQLWRGIDALYSATRSGIAKSEYHIAPFADVSQIQLRYNVSVEFQRDGSLRLNAANGRGYFTESAPVAWQDIDGKRAAVNVAFRLQDNAVGFDVARYDARYALVIDPVVGWTTFWGSPTWDSPGRIATDSLGNVYLTGNSDATWLGDGSTPPRHAYSGATDIFVLKLDSSGLYQWHTFYGSTADDGGSAIAIDADNNLYVTGASSNVWQGDGGANPLHKKKGGLFVLKLSTNGAYRWHTFYGSSGVDVAVDDQSNVYVTGNGTEDWEGDGGVAPLHPHSNGSDLVVLKLNKNGLYQWHTFYGPADGAGIAIDRDQNIYLSGSSAKSWRAFKNVPPLHAHSGGGWQNIVALKLNALGAYQWHTFYGGDGNVYGNDLALDKKNNVYVAATSTVSWMGAQGQDPIHAFAGASDATLLKLNPAGTYQWHTFYDKSGGVSVAVDRNGSPQVTHSWSIFHQGDICPGVPACEFRYIELMAFAPDGVFKRSSLLYHTVGDLGNSWLGSSSVEIDKNNNSYVGGGIMPSPRYPSELANDVMVMKANIAEPAPVRLLKPKNKAVVSKTSPLLDWTDSFNFENYHLELRQDSRTGAILADTTVTESQFKSPALARGKTYFWRVQACNELGCSVWSRWRTFMVAAQ